MSNTNEKLNQSDNSASHKTNVLSSYAVSLVYQKNNVSNVSTALRSKIIEANSREEAIGKLVLELDETNELEGFSLALKTVLLIA